MQLLRRWMASQHTRLHILTQQAVVERLLDDNLGTGTYAQCNSEQRRTYVVESPKCSLVLVWSETQGPIGGTTLSFFWDFTGENGLDDDEFEIALKLAIANGFPLAPGEGSLSVSDAILSSYGTAIADHYRDLPDGNRIATSALSRLIALADIIDAPWLSELVDLEGDFIHLAVVHGAARAPLACDGVDGEDLQPHFHEPKFRRIVMELAASGNRLEDDVK